MSWFPAKACLKSFTEVDYGKLKFCIDKALVSGPSCHLTQRNLVFRTHITKKVGLLSCSHTHASFKGWVDSSTQCWFMALNLAFAWPHCFWGSIHCHITLQVLPLVLRIFQSMTTLQFLDTDQVQCPLGAFFQGEIEITKEVQRPTCLITKIYNQWSS